VSKRISHIDLMHHLDGELAGDEAREVAAALASDADAQRALRSLQQLGECVRTYAELETDDADPALARVWERIESKLEGGAEAATPAPAPAPVPKPRDVGAWARAGEWLDSIRGYFVTGAVAAAAAAALVLVLAQGGDTPTIAHTPSSPGGHLPIQPAALTAQPPEVESLEIYGASGSVLTIPSEGDGGGTAVIWLDREPETEGPI
jgi:negative regulator of sigma E activity